VSTSDKRGPLQVARRARLLEALQRDGVLRISDLTEALGAAAVTIRRDIAQLAAEGLVRRVHGGVALPTEGEPGEGRAAADTGAGGRSVGMLVPSLDYYWPNVAHGAEEAARELDMRIVLRGSSYQLDTDMAQLTRLLDTGVDALIVAPRLDAPTAERTVEWLAALDRPVVLLERTASAGPHHAVLESVVTDHALGAAMAVRHLVSLGHRNVGVVLAEPSPTRPHVRRGWYEAVTECGLDVDKTVEALVPDAKSPECKAALDRVLDRALETGCTALLVHADAEAIALVQRCEERHLTVPGTLSVVAYDDEVAALFSPALTAVRPPRRSIGRAAVRLVADRLADRGRPTHRVVISPSLRIRDSSAPPAP
jgi:DNA-binding LacI/PurR family transcriptional regulator